MDHYSIRGTLLDWMNDFLSERTQQVIINGESSSKGKVISGVPQGTVLGPLLFLIYINDLPVRVNPLIRPFADNTYLYKTIDTPRDTLQLQKDLDALTKWENEWSMEFHPDKCKLVRITNKLKPIEASYYMHNRKLDIVETGKYLGFLLNKKLSWKAPVDTICKKATQTRALLQELKDCQREVISQCYKTYVRPIVEYASVVWDAVGEGNQHIRYQIEMVQRRVARFVTGDWRTTSSVAALIKTLQWQTPEQRRRQSRLIFLHRYFHKAIDITESIAARAEV